MATTTTPSTSVPANKADLDALNSLLRGEISAVETYTQGIAKFSDPEVFTMANVLTRIRDEHQQSVNTLRDRVRAHGGTPNEGAGVWGAFANLVAGAAKLIGPQTVLASLKSGEQHGIDDYEKALKSADVSTELKYLIRNDLMSKCQDHSAAVEQMIKQLEAKAK